MAEAAGFDRNQEATCYVGDLDGQVDEALLWEMMVQCGPVVNVHVPKDKLTQQHMGFGFVEFKSEVDAQYAIKAPQPPEPSAPGPIRTAPLPPP